MAPNFKENIKRNDRLLVEPLIRVFWNNFFLILLKFQVKSLSKEPLGDALTLFKYLFK